MIRTTKSRVDQLDRSLQFALLQLEEGRLVCNVVQVLRQQLVSSRRGAVGGLCAPR